MEQIFFASHGSLAQAMMETAMLIVGEDPRVRAFTLDQYETPFRLADAVRAAMTEGPCVILCDIKGGSVHNQLMELSARPNVRILTGMNLALAASLLSGDEDEDLGGRCQEAMGLGQEDICLFDALFVSHALAQQAAEEDTL